LYHPDKTDNELLKARFIDIKEAYQVLSDPIKRKQYDRTFDNFSYKKELPLTPLQLLEKMRSIRGKAAKLDPHRMDLDKLEFEITELLTEKNLNTLTATEEKEIVQRFIEELLAAANPLTPEQLKPITGKVSPLANETSKVMIQELLQRHSWNNWWHTYKILFAFIAGILLCLLIYFVGK
jgi:molecular chaperone DnaJ